jgi:hypothetical protein
MTDEDQKDGRTPVITPLNLFGTSMHNIETAIICSFYFLKIRDMFYVQMFIKGKDTYSDGHGI